MHRLIVTSELYQLASTTKGSEASHKVDPENKLYWRMNFRRMESQVVRDSLLYLAGKLDQTVGGPSVDPKQGGFRRSIYFLHSRDDRDRFLSMFDDADLMQCYRRSESIVPQQALALSNSKLAFEMSTAISDRLSASVQGDSIEPFIEAVFIALLGREPDSAEMGLAASYYDQMLGLQDERDAATARQRVRARLVHSILNHNDFVTVR